MKAVKFVDVPVSENRDITFQPNDKIIGFTLNNQGTSDVKFVMGNQNPFVTLEAGANTSRGNINAGNDVFYLSGNLVIKAPGYNDGEGWASTFNVVITFVYDVTESIQNDC